MPGATLGATLPPLAGAASRAGANALTTRQLRNIDELVRKRSLLYRQRVANPPREVIDPMIRASLLRSLLLADPQGE